MYPESVNEDDEMKKWMHKNFTEIKKVKELKDCWSYGWRLYNFKGVNQIEWVIERLKEKPESKSVTISMLQKAGKEAYVPCVSLLDFKLRNHSLILTVTCRSLDFGKKSYHNFFNLVAIAHKVKHELGVANAKLLFYIISAHIYVEDLK